MQVASIKKIQTIQIVGTIALWKPDGWQISDGLICSILIYPKKKKKCTILNVVCSMDCE